MYRGADFFFTTTRGESIDLDVLQAMACGCIPICDNFLGHEDYVKHYENALVFGHDLTPLFHGGVPFYESYQNWSNPMVQSVIRCLTDAYQLAKQSRLEELRKNTIITASAFNADRTYNEMDEAVRKMTSESNEAKPSSKILISDLVGKPN
jgi:glycogen synthase